MSSSVNVVISGTGLYHPEHAISNDELVASFNAYVDKYNAEHAEAIVNGELTELSYSSAEFIEKASGIKSRYVTDKEGVLNPERMKPYFPARPVEQISMQAEVSVKAIEQALAQANKTAADVDLVITACSNFQRPYPAISVEIQTALGIDGYAYDMNMACSTATFAIQNGVDAIKSGSARCVVIVNPEITSPHLNWCDRDSHFIFGEATTAVVLEIEETCMAEDSFRILGTVLKTQFSNNIRNNFGFINRCEDGEVADDVGNKDDKLFIQQGRKVFKDVCPMVVRTIKSHAESLDIAIPDFKRLWLHQANINMIQYITKKLLGDNISEDIAPIELDRFANTSSAAAVIAFHTSRQGLKSGDKGVICSFGAGYSIGSVIVEKR